MKITRRSMYWFMHLKLDASTRQLHFLSKLRTYNMFKRKNKPELLREIHIRIIIFFRVAMEMEQVTPKFIHCYRNTLKIENFATK